MAPIGVILAIDPGDKNNGYALFINEKPVEIGTKIGFNQIIQFTNVVRPDVIIVEEYKLYPHLAKEQSWSHFQTVEVIGGLKGYVALEEVRGHAVGIIEQSTDNRDMGYQWADLKRPRTKERQHPRDAFAHGAYYLIKVRNAPILQFRNVPGVHSGR